MLLSLIGFDSTPGAINSDNQILGLKLLFSFACPICFFIVLLIVRKYPITEDVQLDIREKLEKQKRDPESDIEASNV